MSDQTGFILVVDDDRDLCELVQEYLVSEGFPVDLFHEGEGASQKALSGEYVLVILDVMLPGMNGFDVLREIRSRSQLPVLMLTAKGEEIDRIVGLEVGADDYLPKPFNPRELVARIRAILRRAQNSAMVQSADAGHFTVGDLQLEMASRVVLLDGEPISLTAVEFDLLAVFLRKAGTAQKREDLVRLVLEREFSPYDRSIDMHVSKLRRKLGPHDDGTDRIRSIRSVGYLYTVPRDRKDP
jgi:two-component system response regulator CpxR